MALTRRQRDVLMAPPAGIGAIRKAAVRRRDVLPDSEMYLHDDWGDNKLQDREDSGTTTYNGVEGVYRPEWNIQEGSPSVSDESVLIESSDMITTDINLNLDETITWEWTDVDNSDAGTVSSDALELHCFAEQNQDTSFSVLHESYSLSVRRADERGLRVRDSGGSPTDLIDIGEITGPVDLTVTRSPSGEWEVFVDGVSQGTATDTTFTDPQYIAFSAHDDGEGEIGEVKVS